METAPYGAVEQLNGSDGYEWRMWRNSDVIFPFARLPFDHGDGCRALLKGDLPMRHGLTRQQLYDMIWEIAVSKAAVELGMLDAASRPPC